MTETLFALAPFALVAGFAFFHWSLWRGLRRFEPPARRVPAWTAWFGLVPVLGIPATVALSLLLAVRARKPGRPRAGDAAWAGLALAASLSIGALFVPYVGPGIALAGAPFWIAFPAVVRQMESSGRQRPGLVPERLLRRLPGALVAICACLLAISVVTATTAAFRLEIWSDSGLWLEPTARIERYTALRNYWSGAAILLLCSLPLLWMVAAERKRVVLYLRKFRDDGVNKVLRRTVQGGLMGHFRLITLDDQSFQPVTSRGSARGAAGMALVTGSVMTIGLLGVVSVYLADGLAGFAQAEWLFRGEATLWLLLPLYLWRRGEDLWPDVKAALADLPDGAGEYYGEFVELFLGGFSTTYFGLGFLLAVAGVLAATGLVRLHLVGRSRVATLTDLKRFTARLPRLQTTLFAPSLAAPPASVVTVETAIWQPAVLGIAAKADVIVLDVSEFTAAIAWEVDEMLARHPVRCLFLADPDRFAVWSARHRPTAEAVKGARLLLYDRPSGIDRRTLAAALDAIAPPRGPALTEWIRNGLARLPRREARRAGLAAVLLLAAVLSGSWLLSPTVQRAEREIGDTDVVEPRDPPKPPAEPRSKTAALAEPAVWPYPERCTKVDDPKARFRPDVAPESVIVFGPPEHGKLRLTSALTDLFGTLVPVETLASAPAETARGMELHLSPVQIDTEQRPLLLFVSREEMGMAKAVVTGAVLPDAGILVLDADRAPPADLADHLGQMRRAGVATLAVYLHRRDARELNIGEMLAAAGYDPQIVPVVGAPPLALTTPGEDAGAALRELVAALAGGLRTDTPLQEAPFLMPIEDVIAVAGRDTVVTGRVTRGIVGTSDALELVGLGPTRAVASTGVEMFRKDIDCGVPGNNLGVALDGVAPSALRGGQVLATPGSIRAHTRFEAELYLLAEREGGLAGPLESGSRLDTYLRTTDVPAVLTLPNGGAVSPGRISRIEITLDEAVALETGQRFALRKEGRTVGVGLVTGLDIDQGTGPQR